MMNAVTRRGALSALAGVTAAFGERAELASGDHAHPRIDPRRVHRYEEQVLAVDDFPADDLILDVGGGGEGIIGRIKRNRVVAIDLSRRELEGTPPGPLKTVMDATDLKFLDASFSTATVFFTFMYMQPEAQRKALAELHRVLKPKGRALIWEVLLPAQFDAAKDIAVYRFRFRLPHEEVRTGYGAHFPDRAHDTAFYTALARAAGFDVLRRTETGRTCFLELMR
jgi:SAM-dependent methyltransferase